MWVLKSKLFVQKSTYSLKADHFTFGIHTRNGRSSKRVKIVLSTSKLTEMFLIFFWFENTNFWAIFFTSFFEALYFLKLCPMFDELSFFVFTKYNGFLWACWFLAKVLLFGRAILEIPQPNSNQYVLQFDIRNYMSQKVSIICTIINVYIVCTL